MYASIGQRTPEQQVKHYKMGKVLKSNSTTKNKKNTEINETTRENNEPTWKTRIHHMAVEFASTVVGQTMMMQSEKLLWTLEKTATWISNGKTGKRKTSNDQNQKKHYYYFTYTENIRRTQTIIDYNTRTQSSRHQIVFARKTMQRDINTTTF